MTSDALNTTLTRYQVRTQVKDMVAVIDINNPTRMRSLNVLKCENVIPLPASIETASPQACNLTSDVAGGGGY